MIPHYLNKMLKPPVSGIQGFRSQQEADLKTRTCKNTQKEEEEKKKKDDGNRNSFLGWSMDKNPYLHFPWAPSALHPRSSTCSPRWTLQTQNLPPSPQINLLSLPNLCKLNPNLNPSKFIKPLRNGSPNPDQNGLTLQKWWNFFCFDDPKNMRLMSTHHVVPPRAHEGEENYNV